MRDTNLIFKASIIIYKRYLNGINAPAFFNNIIRIFEFCTRNEQIIIQGLRTIDNITNILIDTLMIVGAKLMLLAKSITQVFFGFFGILFNTISTNETASLIWFVFSSFWVTILSVILGVLGIIVTGTVFGIIIISVVKTLTDYLNSYFKPPQEPRQATINGNDLIIN